MIPSKSKQLMKNNYKITIEIDSLSLFNIVYKNKSPLHMY